MTHFIKMNIESGNELNKLKIIQICFSQWTWTESLPDQPRQQLDVKWFIVHKRCNAHWSPICAIDKTQEQQKTKTLYRQTGCQNLQICYWCLALSRLTGWYPEEKHWLVLLLVVGAVYGDLKFHKQLYSCDQHAEQWYTIIRFLRSDSQENCW